MTHHCFRWVQSDHSIFGVRRLVRILYAMSNERERVISVTLSETEWQAFVARQPQPVNWLREQIRAEAKPTSEPKPERNEAA